MEELRAVHCRQTGGEVMLVAQEGKVSRWKMSLPVVLRKRVTIPTQRRFMRTPVSTMWYTFMTHPQA
jgi:hypothetical protein